MPRIPMPDPTEMTDAQRRVYDSAVAGRRGYAPAPLIAWLNSPELADLAQKLGEFARYRTSLPSRLSELAILVTARFWKSQYEWFAHKSEALKAGLSPAIVDDIAHNRQPQFEKQDEAAVYEFVTSLQKNHVVPDNVYRETVNVIGDKGVVDLVGLLGYYTLISMTINALEIDVPPGAHQELK